MSRARKLFQYVDLQGSTVTSPTSEGRVTSSMTSSNGDATVRIDDVSSSLTSNGDSVDKMLRQRRRKRNFMILAGVCGVAIMTIIGLTYQGNASKIIAAIPSAFASASQGRTGEHFWPVILCYVSAHSIVKILNLYIIPLCTHLYHFFLVSIHYLQCIHCLLHFIFCVLHVHSKHYLIIYSLHNFLIYNTLLIRRKYKRLLNSVNII